MALILEEFRAWLQSLDGQDLAGLRGEAHACPLSRYLSAKGAAAPWVDGENYSPLGYELRDHHPLPEWARAFVERVDGPLNGGTPGVLVNEALEYLDQIERIPA